MSKAKEGDTVLVHYNGKLEDGSMFDSSQGGEPLKFTLGEGEVIGGFDLGIVGMAVGESKTLKIEAEQAYGPRHDEWMIVVERDKFPPDITPEVGQQLELNQEEGPAIPVTVSAVDEKNVTLDANHPLAGKDLTFEVELVEIV